MNRIILDFEKPLIEIEKKIEELELLSSKGDIKIQDEIKRLKVKLSNLQDEIFEKLTPWERVQVARHPDRPYSKDYINALIKDFVELHGDKTFADDKAIIGGIGLFEGKSVVVVGQQKGRGMKENLERNFGMANPEGYRKALRLFIMAETFNKPIITFIDTPGAYPGIGAEERGIAQAIALNLREMSRIKVPIIVVVIGEGGSGGALGIGVGDRILMLKNSIYSVISPEGCAAILWHDRAEASKAASALHLTAKDLFEFKVIDEIIDEPAGGAHRNPEKTIENVKNSISRHLNELLNLSVDEMLNLRYQKYRRIGVYSME